MPDPRVERWADVLVNYSLNAQPKQHAVIIAEVEAMPLVEACYQKFIEAGAIVEPMFIPRSFSEILFRYASDEQLQTTPPVAQYIAERCDLYLMIGAETNSKLLAGVEPKRQAIGALSRKPILETILGRAAKKEVRWAYTHYPTPAAAQDAEMGSIAYEDFVFSLCSLNTADPIGAWKAVEKRQQVLIDYLQECKELHFTNGDGTDLTVDVAGMTWVNCCGKINFPDGEVYTGPNLQAGNGGVNGIARLALPTLYRNVEVHDIELRFENGRVVEAKASKGEDFLKAMIELDEGAKYVGEIALGTNYHMQHITKNILFDEKFGGTFHLALGKGYPQTGNTNESGLHWDMIFDLRNGGAVFADGELINENGRFTRPEWPQPGVV